MRSNPECRIPSLGTLLLDLIGLSAKSAKREVTLPRVKRPIHGGGYGYSALKSCQRRSHVKKQLAA